jgi:hypothetical protein
LARFGRHTITGLLRNQNRTQQDWTADYRLYTESRLEVEKIFGHVRTEVEQYRGPDRPLVVAMDDSILRKTGRRIFGCGYRRDPLSPPFPSSFQDEFSPCVQTRHWRSWLISGVAPRQNSKRVSGEQSWHLGLRLHLCRLYLPSSFGRFTV